METQQETPDHIQSIFDELLAQKPAQWPTAALAIYTISEVLGGTFKGTDKNPLPRALQDLKNTLGEADLAVLLEWAGIEQTENTLTLANNGDKTGIKKLYAMIQQETDKASRRNITPEEENAA